MADQVAHSDYLFLRDFLRDRIGHDLGDDKQYLVDSRLRPIVDASRLSGLAALFDRLRRTKDRGLEVAVLEAMVTGETSFFRGLSAFDRFRRKVMPELVKARENERKLSFWCAGCSTGQEPYSIAMTMLDHFPELARWDISIVATDLSEPALRQARDGEYSDPEVRRGLSDLAIRNHFQSIQGRWRIKPETQRRVTFRKLNLVDAIPFHDEFDVIFLRNVLIYFCQEKKREVFAAARQAIRDDGYLFLGESETVLGQCQEFVLPTGDFEYFRPAPPSHA